LFLANHECVFWKITPIPGRGEILVDVLWGENCDKGMGNRENVKEKLRKIKDKEKYKNECKRGK
jgi:hypothetical protein